MHEVLGTKVRDRITGFSGVVTGRVEYLTGCNQVLVSPPAKEDGSLVAAEWLDEQRLEVISEDRILLDNGASPGCDRPAPRR
ncbi:hypothetical protein [Chelativorans sp.]|uniref:hypothetical protein n=1 Tax=Chelativorans sp. TaxID=2203393 RepID=UPI002811FC53|nr:hypothetical protein [Chelativorans sp.]